MIRYNSLQVRALVLILTQHTGDAKSGPAQHMFPFQTWINSFFPWQLLRLQLFMIPLWSHQLSLPAPHLLSHGILLSKCPNCTSTSVPGTAPRLTDGRVRDAENAALPLGASRKSAQQLLSAHINIQVIQPLLPCLWVTSIAMDYHPSGDSGWHPHYPLRCMLLLYHLLNSSWSYPLPLLCAMNTGVDRHRPAIALSSRACEIRKCCNI